MLIDRWFGDRGLEPAAFQRQAWEATVQGESLLIHAPTGAGKTLAAIGGALEYAACGDQGGLRVLWLTPMRALANDSADALSELLGQLGLNWRVGVRSGDTSSSERQRQRSRWPEILITTPESLALMLSHTESQTWLADLRLVVCDEWHELLGSKRGVALELALARVHTLAPRATRIALSATLGNLDQACAVLAGATHAVRLIQAGDVKKYQIDTLLPEAMERLPWAGHLGLRQLPGVLQAIAGARSTIVYTNTRAQAELWFQALSACAVELTGALALHHGSLAASLRAEVEDGLRSGRLRCVVATASLDLGVDFAPVDQVIQIGSPKGIARLMQRAGRAGHRPSATSRLLVVPTMSFELLEIAAARRAIAARKLEPRRPLEGCADVLCQHMVTLSLAGGIDVDCAFREICTTHAYRHWSRTQFDRVLAVVTQGGDALARYPAFNRVRRTGNRLDVPSRRVATLHRLSIGTISADGALKVAFANGTGLGMVEESFIARLKPGDRFVFAGRTLELQRVVDATAQVRIARGSGAQVPRWMGGKFPLSTELADEVRNLLADPDPTLPELTALLPTLALQDACSRRPRPDQTLIEVYQSRDGQHWFIYPFAGRQVHDGLAALLAHRLGQRAANSFSFSVSDYGFEIWARRALMLTVSDWRQLLTTAQLLPDLLASLNSSELERRQFREIARVAGLIHEGLPGQAKSFKQLQASSGLLFDALCAHDPGHLLLEQSRTEMLSRHVEYPRLQSTLKAIADSEIIISELRQPSPMAFPLYAEQLRNQLSTERWQQRLVELSGQQDLTE